MNILRKKKRIKLTMFTSLLSQRRNACLKVDSINDKKRKSIFGAKLSTVIMTEGKTSPV